MKIVSCGSMTAIPAGFALVTTYLTDLVTKGTIAKFQVNARSVVVYLRGLEAGKELKLEYHLRATMPVKITAPAGIVYEYYDPAKRGVGKSAQLTVIAKR